MEAVYDYLDNAEVGVDGRICNDQVCEHLLVGARCYKVRDRNERFSRQRRSRALGHLQDLFPQRCVVEHLPNLTVGTGCYISNQIQGTLLIFVIDVLRFKALRQLIEDAVEDEAVNYALAFLLGDRRELTESVESALALRLRRWEAYPLNKHLLQLL